ncbi:acetylxylan esterase [Paenibacillus sp. HWE-109]|uniref:alpha/beta hydrolase family protein n=1 Tax=Paenibacillus sp. HWE-109 TaxID=1306526 RepID=UPI001EE067DD|nr:acetylxylan esterase [Paenibacillus sp. HWE-109]UKS28672.1 acetylxylan esterase [Paenibacillus sp. HWE-109]
MNQSQPALPWNLEALNQVPNVFPIPEMDEGNIKAIFYEGLPYQGRKTRVFAYYGMPESMVGAKLPGIVLVHGGGGAAFKEWVQLWVDRGYAAIAMDLEGHIGADKNQDGVRPNHEWSGPFRQGEFADYELPVDEQWMYHAVADVILANSFLRSLDNVAEDTIGIHGVSWGGIVTGIVAGVDVRFTFAIPVYGCGYLYEASNQYGRSFAQMSAEFAAKVKQLWDPSAYFHRIAIPMLWVNWSHDPHFPLHLFSKSFQAAKQGVYPSSLSIHFGLRHSHAAGWKPLEIYAFADHLTKGSEALAQIVAQEVSGNQLSIQFTSEIPIVKAELRYALNTSNWFEVEWLVKEAHLDRDAREIRADLEAVTSAYFVQITDQRGCIVSTPLYDIKGESML